MGPYTLTLADVTFVDGAIIDYLNTMHKDIIIPDNFNDVAVTSISERAFTQNLLKTVEIPNSVTTLGDQAFSYNELESVTIPNSVTDIGVRAFQNNQLTSVTIPNSLLKLVIMLFREIN